MSKFITYISLALILFYSFNTSAQYSTDSYMVSFDANTTQAEINAALTELNSTEIWVSPISQTRLWKVDSFPFYYPVTNTLISNINETNDEARARAKTNGGGLNYATNPIINSTAPPPNPNFRDHQLDCEGQLSTYIPNSHTGVIVGVFDTGLEYSSNPNIPNYFFNLEGYHEYDHLDNDPIAQDEHGHGTQMASIAAHIINKSYSLQESYIEPSVQYDIRRTFDESGEGYIAEIIMAMEQATLQGMKVANCSWSFEASHRNAYDSPLYTSLSLLESAYGVLIIAAAGNNSKDLDHPQNYNNRNYPAAYDLPNILTATSYDCNNDLTSYANYGHNSVDIALPGFAIPALQEGALVYNSGTSQSAAILSGITASLGSHQATFSYEKIICAIMESATPHPNLTDKVRAGGLIDADEALILLADCGSTGGNIGVRNINSSTSIYPNPNKGHFHINFDSSVETDLTLTIYDSNGRLVSTKQVKTSNGLNSFELINETLSSGIYTLTLKTTNKTESYKLVVKS